MAGPGGNRRPDQGKGKMHTTVVHAVRVALLARDSEMVSEIERVLSATRFPCTLTRVSNPSVLRETTLATEAFDVLLAQVAALDNPEGELARLRALKPETPLILILGAGTPDDEVERLSAAAADYVFENRLQRLGPSVARAVRDAAERRELRQAEAALKVSERRLQLALDASEVTVWEYDVSSGEVRFSRQLGPMLGYADHEISGRIEAWEGITHPDDLPGVKSEMIRHFRGESAMIDIEYRIRACDGDWRWLHTVGRVIGRDSSGRATVLSGTHRDVTERRRSHERLRLLQLAIDATTNAVLIADARRSDQPIVHVNRAFERMTGYMAAEVIGRNCRFMQGDDSDQAEVHQVRAALNAAAECSVVVRNYRKDGSLFWNNLQISPVRESSGELTHFVGVLSDVTELKNYQARLEHRATHDALTGLLNRRALYETLNRLVAHASRARERLTVLYLDLDRFKGVNDNFGHASGDELLVCIADRLKSCVRQSDIVARLGGDEFAVVLTDARESVTASSVAQKIRDAIEQPVTLQRQQVVAASSIGVSVYPEDAADAEGLVRNADAAMYRAKSRGGTRICFYTEDLNRIAKERLSLETALRLALARDEFELHYQPCVEAKSHRITSVEALLRWRRSDDELVLPGCFVPLAEETGLIVPLGIWTLRAACTQMRKWLDAGHGNMRVSVNLSARQLREPDFVGTLQRVLAESRLEPRYLELEIKESVAMNDPEEMHGVFKRMSELGVSLAIDDFGTARSSLAYLKRFQFDYLKIDHSLVHGIRKDENDESVVRSIIALGKLLKLVVIAEGVESEEQRAFLESEACDEMQGFLFGSPRPATEIVGLFA